MKHWTQAIGDLAPGDLHCADFDWSDYQIISLSQKDQELFQRVYSLMWEEFGEKGELEPAPLLYERLAWDPLEIREGRSLAYEILVILKDDEIIALRDHSIITCVRSTDPRSVIHLSHAWIKSEYRKQGISGWLRAWPIQKARECIQRLNLPSHALMILAAEMEHFAAHIPERMRRLKSYAKAQFKTLDPQFFPYSQPDFRLPLDIDQSGGPRPVPLALLLRRLGKEHEDQIPLQEAKEVIESIYHMYSQSIREQDMLPLWKLYQDTFSIADELNLLKLLHPIPHRVTSKDQIYPEQPHPQTLENMNPIVNSNSQNSTPLIKPNTPTIRREGSH
ncbi:GNAT family N-acetyltransferase [bacterium]|jgi:hypothetical protein|nr:GNAT family N-acetyltransferase [bacterium]